MKAYSLESSLAEHVRRKAPAMDIAPVSNRKIVTPTSRVRLPAATISSSQKGLDGIRTERHSLLLELQEQTWSSIGMRLVRRGQLYRRRVRRLLARVLPAFSPHKMLYASIMSGIAFGMVSMAFIEHAFGPGVFARSETAPVVNITPTESLNNERTLTPTQEYNPDQDVFFEYFGQVTKEKYEESIREMVKGYPIEAMLPYIFEQDRLTAAFLIGIGKKESNWGKRIPVLEGQDCFNYWGYRGVRRMMGTGGHTCFNSRKDAVETVAHRLERLIQSEKLDTPEKMIVWKCGFSCQGHSRESVKKWISDVDMYFSQLSDE